jgi:hypothetical protein
MTDNIRTVKGPGRPTTYDPSLGERIVSIMEQGLSLAAAAAECDVHRRRVYDWEQVHPDFAELVQLARVKRQAFLERRLLKAETGAVVTSSIFALKNAGPDDWRDKQEVDHSSSDGSMKPQVIEFITPQVADARED